MAKVSRHGSDDRTDRLNPAYETLIDHGRGDKLLRPQVTVFISGEKATGFTIQLWNLRSAAPTGCVVNLIAIHD